MRGAIRTRPWLDCFFWLQDLKEEGLIGHLGLANFDTAHLRIALTSGIDIVSNQVSYSLIDQRARGGMADLCLEHGIKLLVNGTLAGGLLTDRWIGEPRPELEDLTTWSEAKYWRFIRAAGGWDAFQHILECLAVVAKKHRVSIANVACRYMLDLPAVGAIIIGARVGEREHIQDNLRVFGFSLTKKNRSDIEYALTRLDPLPGDCGDEYRKAPFLTATGEADRDLDAFPRPYQTKRSRNRRSMVLTGTAWEETAGFSRAVRHLEYVWISGTDRDAPVTRHRREGPRSAGPLRDRQDRGGAPLHWRLSRGCGPYTGVYSRYLHVGGCSPGTRRAVWSHPPCEYDDPGRSHRRRIPDRDRGGGRGSVITITSYNEDWPERFGEIRDCLRAELAGEAGAFEVEHFGSTAVPGLAARPVLDLCVVVPDASGLPALLRGLDRLGYVYEQAQRVPGLETLRRKGPDVPFLAHKRDFSPHHLYAAVSGAPDLGPTPSVPRPTQARLR